MITTISESIQVATSDNKVVIRQEDRYEGQTVDLKICDRAEAIALANELLKWANQQEAA